MSDEQRKLLEALHTLKKWCNENECPHCTLYNSYHNMCRVQVNREAPGFMALRPLEKEPWTPFLD